MKIRKGDRVRVMAGKDKGREGKVSRAIPADNKVIVEGGNIAKRHQKSTSVTCRAASSTMPYRSTPPTWPC